MDNKEEILNNFLVMTESSDYGLAMEYLENNQWDLAEAVSHFQNTHKFTNGNQNPAPIAENRPNIPNYGMNDHVEEWDDPMENRPDYLHQEIENERINSEPRPENNPPNQPESLIGNAMNDFSNFASNMATNMMGSIGNAFSGFAGPNRNHHFDSEMEDANVEELLPSGRFFLEKFREKNGTSIELPTFVEGSFDMILKESKRLKRPIFIYLHNHKGDSCTIVDQTVIGEDIVKTLVNRFICVGVNVNSEEGRLLMDVQRMPGAPYMSLMYYDEDNEVQNIGSMYAEEINVNSLFEMCDSANQIMENMFYPVTDIPSFNVADSHLNVVETLDVQAELEDRLKNRATTGFVESRTRTQQIDPETGYPVGMTEQQIQDKKLKEEQKQELEAAMQADKEKLIAAAKAEEERKEKQLEQAKKKEAKEVLLKFKEQEIEETKANLPDEPEDGPDVTTIQFRLPNSQTIQRRFKKTDTIKLMVDFIVSLGTENG